MSYRFMRVIIFFDLPTTTSAEIRQYTKFRKFLLKSGFFMLQESVYSKLVLNATACSALVGNIRKHKPPAGLVQLLTVTEKQYAEMELIVGESVSETINSDERLVLL